MAMSERDDEEALDPAPSTPPASQRRSAARGERPRSELVS